MRIYIHDEDVARINSSCDLGDSVQVNVYMYPHVQAAAMMTEFYSGIPAYPQPLSNTERREREAIADCIRLSARVKELEAQLKSVNDAHVATDNAWTKALRKNDRLRAVAESIGRDAPGDGVMLKAMKWDWARKVCLEALRDQELEKPAHACKVCPECMQKMSGIKASQ